LSQKTLPSGDVSGALVKHFFKLYIFADIRGIGNLANDTITMLASYWTQETRDLSEVGCELLVILRNGKLYDLILDNSILELRAGEMDFDRLAASDLPKEFLIDLLHQTVKLSGAFDGHLKCFRAVCHYHCHEIQGVMGEEECIRNTEAGCNTYYDHKNLKQVDWEEDV
jgi:hypothetical protein